MQLQIKELELARPGLQLYVLYISRCDMMVQLGIKQVKSAPYHPQSQGALERLHQTLKNMVRAYCFQESKDWDKGIPLFLFAARESIQESIGFSLNSCLGMYYMVLISY